MLQFRTNLVLVLMMLFALLSLAECSPFLYLLGWRSGRSRDVGRGSPPEKSYGDICRVMNPSSWTAFGYSEPNCPP